MRNRIVPSNVPGPRTRFSLGASSEDDRFDCLEDDEQVKAKRQVLYVVEIVFELLLCFFETCAVLIAHLNAACKPRADYVTQVVEGNLIGEPLHKFRALRAGADKSHVASKNIPELRNHVKPSLTHESAERSRPRVILGRPHRSLCFSVLPHRPEFDYGKRTSSTPDTRLAKEDGARGREPHSQRDERDKGKADRQPHK